MAIRKLEYTVYLDGLDPAARQFGGIQGEHNATELNFTLCDEIHDSIMSQAEGKTAIYRFEGFDCLGSMRATEPLPLVKNMTYSLENWLTKEGGTIKVHLVISVADGDDTVMDMFTFPALLQLKENPKGETKEPEDYKSIPTLAYRAGVNAAQAKDAANKSENMAAAAKAAQQKTEEAMLALEAGSVIIFQGGNASSKFAVDVVIDGEISGVSSNPVENKVVKQFVETVLEDGTEALKKAGNNEIEIDDLKKDLEETNQNIEDAKALGLRSYGTKDGWTYKIWNNGEAECYCTVAQTFKILQPWANTNNTMYVSSGEQNIVTFPFEFAEPPHCFYALDSYDCSVLVIPQSSVHATTTHSLGIQVVRPAPVDSVNVKIYWEIKGKIKEEE